jgi:GTP cyclohydrolase I
MTQKKTINTDRVAALVRDLLVELGEDPEREGLKRTPERMAKALAFLTGGYRQTAKQVLNGAVFQAHLNHMNHRARHRSLQPVRASCPALLRAVPCRLHRQGQGDGVSKIARIVTVSRGDSRFRSV